MPRIRLKDPQSLDRDGFSILTDMGVLFAHPSCKNKNAARVGHPDIILSTQFSFITDVTQ